MAKTSLSIPEELWDEVRKQAIDRKTTATQICIEALREYLEKHADAE